MLFVFPKSKTLRIWNISRDILGNVEYTDSRPNFIPFMPPMTLHDRARVTWYGHGKIEEPPEPGLHGPCYDRAIDFKPRAYSRTVTVTANGTD